MLKKRLVSLVVAALAVFGLAAVMVSQASAATVENKTKARALIAIYGNPGSNEEKTPVGGGLGRNFGFGENMLFEACEKCTTAVGTNLSFEFETTKAVAKESYIAGTLMSNKTGENNPVSFAIQFADFQDSEVTGVGAVASYADTFDRPWIAEICGNEEGTKCKPTPQKEILGEAKGLTKIENVSINLGPGFVVQGTVWALWGNGKPPCLTLTTPPAFKETEFDTLYVTQTTTGFPAVGTRLKAIAGKACLISANNDWYSAGTEKEENEIVIKKT
jgi:hypothetical protein